MTASPIKGQCACGAIRIKVHGEPVIVAQCHCGTCRRISGAGRTVGAMFRRSAVSMDGDAGAFTYDADSGATVTKQFCRTCGSPVSGSNSRTPRFITIPLGVLNETTGLTVQVVIFEESRPHWDQLEDAAQHYRGQPDWRPGT